MKKGFGKLGSKPPTVGSDSFVDELSRSQRLQERLRAIVHELEATVRMLEQNLHEAEGSVQSRRQVREESARKSQPEKGGRGRRQPEAQQP